MTRKHSRYAKGRCPSCHKVVAVRLNGKAYPHSPRNAGRVRRNEPQGPLQCVGTNEIIVDIVEIVDATYANLVNEFVRTQIAREIRDMVAPGVKHAQVWLEVADFVDRSGEWEDYDGIDDAVNS